MVIVKKSSENPVTSNIIYNLTYNINITKSILVLSATKITLHAKMIVIIQASEFDPRQTMKTG